MDPIGQNTGRMIGGLSTFRECINVSRSSVHDCENPRFLEDFQINCTRQRFQLAITLLTILKIQLSNPIA